MADASEIRELQQLFSIKPHDREAKVKRVCAIYEDSGASSQTRKEIQRYTMQAFEYLDELKLPDAAAAGFRDFGETLMERIS
jgi:geranylgeranyl pyrophosphate synthase